MVTLVKVLIPFYCEYCIRVIACFRCACVRVRVVILMRVWMPAAWVNQPIRAGLQLLPVPGADAAVTWFPWYQLQPLQPHAAFNCNTYSTNNYNHYLMIRLKLKRWFWVKCANFEWNVLEMHNFHSNLSVSWELVTESYQESPMKCGHFTHWNWNVIEKPLTSVVILWFFRLLSTEGVDYVAEDKKSKALVAQMILHESKVPPALHYHDVMFDRRQTDRTAFSFSCCFPLNNSMFWRIRQTKESQGVLLSVRNFKI